MAKHHARKRAMCALGVTLKTLTFLGVRHVLEDEYVMLSKRSTERPNEELKWLELSLVGMGLAISEMNSNTDLIPAVTRAGYA